MNSREQFLKTISHKETDRLVVDFGSTSVTGIHVQTLSALRRHYGLQRKPIRITEPFQMLGEVGWELIDTLGIDVVGAWGENNIFGFNNHSPFSEWKTPWGQRVMVPMNFKPTYDEEGNIYMHPSGDRSLPPSAIMNRSDFAFKVIDRQTRYTEEEPNINDNLEEFSLISDKELEHWRIEIDKAYFSGKAVIATLGGTALGDLQLISGMHLHHPKGIRNAAEWSMSITSRPDYIKKVFEQQSEITIENYRRLFSIVGNKINAVFVCSTDFGGNNSSFCSLEQFEDIWLPYYKKINNWIHQNTQWKTFKHTGGAIEPFLEGFIRAGFDVINPVPVNLVGMEPKRLKAKYGRDLVFWGGGVDTESVLPFGTPEDVRENVLQNCEIFIKNGGFVFNAVHNIPAKVPAKNMVALFEAIQEFNGK